MNELIVNENHKCKEWIVNEEDFAGDAFYFAIPLIRCRDCEYYYPDSRSCNMHDCPGDLLDPWDYCSWGSLKMGGSDNE